MKAGSLVLAQLGAWTCAVTPALAAHGLPEGVPPEPSAVGVAARLALVLWGLALLLSGRRPPRFAVGSLFLVAGTAAGWRLLGGASLLLVVATATAVVAAGLVLHALAPRVALALAASWPLPALYLVHLELGGGLVESRAVLLVLLALGAALGAAFPDAAAGVVGAALGATMLALAWGATPHFWPLLAVFLAGTGWQLALPRFVRPPLLQREPRTPRQRLPGALATTVRWAALEVLVLLAAVLAAPRPQDTADGAHAGRIAALRRSGGGGSDLVLGSADNFYLFGRALPVALLSDEPGLAARLRAAASGRNLAPEAERLRTVKDFGELAAMRRAAAITAAAFRAVAPLIRPGANERDLAATVLAAFAAGGASGVAFPPVVASGANAVVPDYHRDDAELRAGLVVVDIGCSVGGYASDMTRTFPVSGTWSSEERRLLDVVLAAKAAAAAALKPGASLAAIDLEAHDAIERAGFGPWFVHGVSHHVGIEVHDAWADTLAEGMTVTAEPGIYIPAGAAIDPAFWNLGLRVEDTYLVTGDGGVPLTELPEVLASGPPA